jgi:hypothetical protein
MNYSIRYTVTKGNTKIKGTRVIFAKNATEADSIAEEHMIGMQRKEKTNNITYEVVCAE